MSNVQNQTQEVNLLEVRQEINASRETGLETASKLILAKVGGNPRPLITFTPKAMTVPIHYLRSSEYRGLLKCNGQPCVLCQANYSKWNRVILPVYDPMDHRVELLALDDHRDPGSALSKLLAILKNDPQEMSFILIKQDNFVYTVFEKAMPADMDIDRNMIERFMSQWEEGLLDPTSVYPQMTNDHLREIPIVRMAL